MNGASQSRKRRADQPQLSVSIAVIPPKENRVVQPYAEKVKSAPAARIHVELVQVISTFLCCLTAGPLLEAHRLA